MSLPTFFVVACERLSKTIHTASASEMHAAGKKMLAMCDMYKGHVEDATWTQYKVQANALMSYANLMFEFEEGLEEDFPEQRPTGDDV